MARLGSIEVVLGPDGPLRSMLYECLDEDARRDLESFPLTAAGSWLRQRFVRGCFVDLLQKQQGDVVDALTAAGLRSFEIDNPTHVLAALHPSRSVRLAALKLARKLDLNITEVCNFKCQYCYQRARDDDWDQPPSNTPTGIPTVDWGSIIREAASIGSARVKFTGGEPFTHRGFLELIRIALRQSYDEIEICTNLSLLKGRRLDEFIGAVGDGSRIHFHISIDGFDSTSGSRERTKIWSDATFQHLSSVLGLLPRASFSVNSMWTSSLLEANAISSIHSYLRDLSPTRWSISLPYLVRDVVEELKKDQTSFTVPDYEQIVEAARDLVLTHKSDGSPYPLSIPLVYKHEVGSEGFAVSTSDSNQRALVDHPCFPCHGSYFIVGPRGNSVDCLLLSYSNAQVQTGGLVELLRSAGHDNDWYKLTTEVVDHACSGCRYQRVCRGQCANDRWNATGGRGFGRDKSACSLLPASEARVWLLLPADERAAYMSLLNTDGFVPAGYRSMRDIVVGEKPSSSDRWPDGREVPVASDGPTRVRFHVVK